MSLVKLFGAVDGIMSIKTHLEGDFDLSVFLDLAFLFVEEIWHDVKKGSGSILSLISSKKLALSPANDDVLDM